MSGGNHDRPAATIPSRDRVRTVFEDGEPRTAAGVANALGTGPAAVERPLDALVDRDVLGTKRVGEDDGVRIWYPTRSKTTDADPVPDLDAAVADLAVPGTSEMMRSWRRDAVRAAAEYVRDHRRASASEIRDAVFEVHPAGYDDVYVWWETVHPRLADLPGVQSPDENGGVWRYVPPSRTG